MAVSPMPSRVARLAPGTVIAAAAAITTGTASRFGTCTRWPVEAAMNARTARQTTTGAWAIMSAMSNEAWTSGALAGRCLNQPDTPRLMRGAAQVAIIAPAAAATVIGAVAGGLAGSAVEEGATRTPGVEVTVRLDNGQYLAVVQADGGEGFRAGERVRVLRDGGTTRVSR